MRPSPLALYLLIIILAATPAAAESFLQISSPAFAQGAMIPTQFTCQGRDTPPPLNITGVPAAARSLVLIVDDPDAPSGLFTHWIAWNIPPQTTQIGGNATGPWSEGTNDFGNQGYSGPCPPSGTHRYFFRLSALDTTLNLHIGSIRGDLNAAIAGHIIATATLMGRYAKTSQ